MNDTIIVEKVHSETEFTVYHEELRSTMYLKQISNDENLDKWAALPAHSNVINLFQQFDHQEGDKRFRFSLSETTKQGNMYKYIQQMNLKLGIKIEMSYMEMIYDCMIQLTLGLEHAHSHGLVHGTFGLHNVMIGRDGDTNIFKINNFTPGTSLKLPMTNEANFWPFIRNGRGSQAEKTEILMLKDIYSLGICLLELMIGRYNSSKYSITLDSLPLTWAEYAEATPLIQVLIECIQLDAITQRKGKLAGIRQLLIKEHSKFFNKTYYKMGEPFVGKKTDILNKLAIASLFQANY